MQIRWWPGSSQRTTITCTAIYYRAKVWWKDVQYEYVSMYEYKLQEEYRTIKTLQFLSISHLVHLLDSITQCGVICLTACDYGQNDSCDRSQSSLPCHWVFCIHILTFCLQNFLMKLCGTLSIWLASLSQQCWDKAMCWSTWTMLLSESRVRRSGGSLHLSWKFLGWVKLIFWDLTISEGKYTCTTIICNGWQLSANYGILRQPSRTGCTGPGLTSPSTEWCSSSTLDSAHITQNSVTTPQRPTRNCCPLLPLLVVRPC